MEFKKSDLYTTMRSMGMREHHSDLEYNAELINQVLEESDYRTSFTVGIEDDGTRNVIACYQSE